MSARASLFLALLLAGVPAMAQNAPAAKELYDRGVLAFSLQHYQDALDAFEAAWSEHRDPALMFNIAQCQRQLGRYEAAARSYRYFLANGAAGPDAFAAARAAHEMDQLAAAAKAPPAAASAPALAAAPTLAVSAAPAPDRRRALRLAGIAATGLGAGLLVAGGVFAGVAASAGEDALHRDTYDYDADQRLHSFRAGAIAAFAIGGAVTAAGVTMWVMGRRR